MHDPFTLDQLRAFVLVADEGSFSAAARKLRRVQSAVSQAMSTLEGHLGVVLWHRDARRPTLTDEGRALLGAARRLLAEADRLRQLAEGLHGGLEASLHLCVDALFPLPPLAELCKSFARQFPTVDLRVDTQTLSAVARRVLDGSASLGVVTPMGLLRGLSAHHLATIRMIPVVARVHPLAKLRGAIPQARLDEFVQIVLSEREDRDAGAPDQGVLSSRTWRIAELHTKQALLVAGLGWGNLPEHLVREDLARGRLVRIRPEGWSDDQHTLTLSAVHRPDARLGPAHSWLLAHLETVCAPALAPRKPARR